MACGECLKHRWFLELEGGLLTSPLRVHEVLRDDRGRQVSANELSSFLLVHPILSLAI